MPTLLRASAILHVVGTRRGPRLPPPPGAVHPRLRPAASPPARAARRWACSCPRPAARPRRDPPPRGGRPNGKMELQWQLVVLGVLGLLLLLLLLLILWHGGRWVVRFFRRRRGQNESDKDQYRKKYQIQHPFVHVLLAATMKSNGGNITSMDFSKNGKYLATCADDHTIHVWNAKNLLQQEHRNLQVRVKLDHATLVRFSPDSRALITWMANANTIRIYKIHKKESNKVFQPLAEDFPKMHNAPIINIGIAETGKFIMSVSSDTMIVIWSLKGKVITIINTKQMNNTYAVISPCSRFVGSCGFVPDVKVWEISFDKSHFREVNLAFELKGHASGIHHLAFSSDSGRMATVSKDGTWKLWAIDVEYKHQRAPYTLVTGLYNEAVTMPCILALSPDAQVVALASSNNIRLYNTKRGEEEETFDKVHGERVAEMTFDITGRFLASCGDSVLRIFHNTTGQRAIVEEIKGLLKQSTTESTRQRLNQQLKKAQATLNKLGVVKA